MPAEQMVLRRVHRAPVAGRSAGRLPERNPTPQDEEANPALRPYAEPTSLRGGIGGGVIQDTMQLADEIFGVCPIVAGYGGDFHDGGLVGRAHGNI